MLKDPNELYDPQGIEQGPGDPPSPSPAKGRSAASDYLSLRAATPDAQPRMGATFSTEGADPADVNKYMGEQGVGDPNITGQPILYDIGQRQSVWNKVGRRIANLVPNMAANLIDIVGYTGALATEWGDNRDYDNVINQWAQSIRDPAGTNAPRTDQSTIGSTLSDPTWWVDNGFMLAEFAIPYAVGGAGIGMAFGEGATAFASALKLGAEGTAATMATGQGLAAGMLAYSEAAQAGAQVYKEIYGTQLAKQLADGNDLDTSKENAGHIASQSAATTVQIATILSTALNLHSVAPYFQKAENVAAGILGREVVREAGESAAEWAARVRALDPARFNLIRGGLRDKIISAANEGTEEVFQQFGQVTGTELGKQGKTKGFFDQWDEVEHFVERIANKDGILSFALGAAGGLGMEYVQHSVLPTARINRVDSNGNTMQALDKNGELQFDNAGNPIYQKKWVTPHKTDEWNTIQQFTNMRDALASDITNFDKTQATYIKAVTDKNLPAIDQARDEMFNVNQMYAIRAGITEPWIQTYQDIAALTPAEAVAKGYTSNEADTEYKTKAEEAISNIKEYTEEYDKLKSRYGTQYTSNPGTQQMVDMMFARKVDLLSWDKMLKKHATEITRLEAEENEKLNIANPDEFNATINDLFRKISSSTEVRTRMQEDLDALKIAIQANDSVTLKRLVKKYRAVGINDADMTGAVDDLYRKISTHNDGMNERLKALEDTVFSSLEYTDWLTRNPTGTFEAFMKDLQRKNQMSAEILAYKANLEESKQQYEIAQQNYNDITNDKSVAGFTQKANDWLSKLQQERAAAEQSQNDELSRRAKDKTSLTRLQKIELNNFTKRYKDRLAKNRTQYNEAKTGYYKTLREYARLSIWKNPFEKNMLREMIQEYKTDMMKLDREVSLLNSKINELAVDTSTPEVEMPIETVTNENADVEEEAPQVEEMGAAPEEVETESVAQTQSIEESAAAAAERHIDKIPDIIDPANTVMDDFDVDGFFAELDMRTAEVVGEDESYQAFRQLWMQIDDAMNSHVVTRMADIEAGLRGDSIAFSYDLLNPEIVKGYITQAAAAQLLQLLKEYINNDEQLATEATMEEIGDNTAQIPEVQVDEIPQMDSSDVPLPDSPVINNLSENSAAMIPSEDDDYLLSLDDTRTHAGFKTTNVLSIANTTLEYTEAYDEKKNRYYKIPLNTLNPKLNQDILRASKLNAGTAVIYMVDTEYDGAANINDQMALDDQGNRQMTTEKYDDYADANGRVKPTGIYNVPIKIVDIESGKTIGYVRKMDWITAKYPKTSDYRNVVDIITDKEGNEIDNMAIQIAAIKSLRENIVNQFNANGKSTDGTITTKKAGMLILNRSVNLNNGKSEVKLGYARSVKEEGSLLPDQSLQIAIVNSGQVYTGYNYQFPLPTIKDKVDLIDGSVVVMLPTANGNYTYGALVGQRLAEGKRKSAVTTVARAIELYLLNNGADANIVAEVEKIQKNTGFDISTEPGLRNFINQYFTYTRSFKLTDTAANAPSTEGQERISSFEFQIWDRMGNQTKGNIKLGWLYSGRPVVEAIIRNGKINPEFVQALEEGFTTRSRAVVYSDTNRGMKGINSSGQFQDVIYTSDGKWRYVSYPSYNEYIKSFSKTAIYGRNQLDDGSYTYVTNPSITIEAKKNIPTVETQPNKSGTNTNIEIAENNRDKIASQYKDTLAPYDNAIEYATRNQSSEDTIADLRKQRDSILDSIISNPANKASIDNIIGKAKVDEGPGFDLGAADLFDDLIQFGTTDISSPIEATEIGTAPENAKELSIQSLEELYTFTPEGERNGKTVQEVYEQMSRNGQTFLADGHNPFSRCI